MTAIRPFTSDDAPELLSLFRDTIRRANVGDYAPEQIEAWASSDIDPAAWAAQFAGRFAVVAQEVARLVGFADLEFNGHIDRLYVSVDRQRRGIGRSLVEALTIEARRRGMNRLFAEVSITARPFFEAQGFVVRAQQTATCRGVEFLNYRMDRTLETTT